MSALERMSVEDYGQAEAEVGELIVEHQVCIKGANNKPGVASTVQVGLHKLSWLDEEMVPDVRSHLTPAEMVDQKLDATVGTNYRGIRWVRMWVCNCGQGGTESVSRPRAAEKKVTKFMCDNCGLIQWFEATP